MKLSAHFDRNEFACRCGCGLATVDAELLIVLSVVRNHFDSAVKITSGHRCTTHNQKVGGTPKSLHLQGRAADIKVKGVAPEEVYAYLCAVYPDQYGFIQYPSFVHVDSRDVPYRSVRK